MILRLFIVQEIYSCKYQFSFYSIVTSPFQYIKPNVSNDVYREVVFDTMEVLLRST